MARAFYVLLCLLVATPPIVTARSGITDGQVYVEICEQGVPKDNTFPEEAQATESYYEEAFGLFELPQKYVATGVRGDRAYPTLVRATAEVKLPPGKHRVLLRSRGPARLHVAGTHVLATPFDQPRQFVNGNIGELPVEEQDTYIDLGHPHRFAPPGNREALAEVVFTGEPTRVVLETLIGGIEPKSKRPFRHELGETVVAISLAGSSDWFLLSPGGRRVPYTDAGWAAYEAESRVRLDRMNAEARAARRAEHAHYWQRRREVAAAYLAGTPEERIPELPPGYPEHNAVDRFLGAQISVAAAAAKARPAGGVDFHRQIKPILEAQCYSCHQGSKVKGGLRLDVHEEALLGGNADGPAIVPHKPDESAIIQRIMSDDPDVVMPAKGDRLPARDIELLRRWISEGAAWPEFAVDRFELTPLADDRTFLRRVFLDTIGVVPSEAEIAAFEADRSPDRRTRLIDRLLADPRWADHQMGYWLDVLAENPNLINPTLNNTGPFRWWLYESFLDNKPLDLFVTELIRMDGSERFGGPAGFGVASQNDVPMAAKGIIVGSAFLGVEMKCARCHDAPTHAAKQSDLFRIAAMLEQKPIEVPATSSVSLEHLRTGGREPMIEVTLQPGTAVEPGWPFAEFCDEATIASIAEQPDNSRDRLAALITAPQNERFAQVMVNRIWERLMGRGFVQTVGDWEKSSPSHPHLLRWLARELIRSGYDMKAIARIILNSHAYQRAVDPTLTEPSPLFAAPAPRAMQAEQLVDSLFVATGKPFAVERVTLDPDGVRNIDGALDLGRATRAWMLASTSNERDRPSLVLPRIQAVAAVLEVFGWRGARPDPTSGIREAAANVLQPALLANGTMMLWLTRLSDDHGLTRLALEEQPVERLVDRLFLRLFTREPTASEREQFVAALRPGYADRIVAQTTDPSATAPRSRPKFVAWSNHMRAEANQLRLLEAEAARRGDPPTGRLQTEWRERLEDALWALLNAPEWTQVR